MQKQVVIIGAGLSGLSAAQALNRAGIPPLVLDKGSRPGGRMAARPFEGAIFDYGAQFFTVRSEKFASMQRGWEARGLVKVWSKGFNGQQDGHPRYIAPGGMNSLASDLALGITVRNGVKVSGISLNGGQWRLETDSGEVLVADGVIATMPVEQTLALLDFVLAAEERETLGRIEYERCLALMAILDQPAELPEPGARQLPGGEPVSWMADNQRKGLTAVANAVTIHAGPEFSLSNWEMAAEDVAAIMLGQYQASAWKLHRWKFAKPSVMHPEACFVVTAPCPLVLAGDAFGEARMEGAALSGLAAAERLQVLLSRP
ncbi:MAG: NAD(P)/FAD-dependent oxidoreductase [Acidobacteriota bacterium]